MNVTQNIFDCEETFNKIYEECMDAAPMASETIRTHYNEMIRHFEEYFAAREEDTFRYAYQCGYEAAKKGGAAV